MKKVLSLLMVLGAIMFYCHDAQSQISIRAFEFNTNFNHSPAGTGAGSDLLGTDLNLRMQLHHAELPDALDFYVGIQRRESFWQNGNGPIIYVNHPDGTKEKLNFGTAEGPFQNDAYSKLLICFGPAYTLSIGKRFGWTNELMFLFAPIPWSRLPYHSIGYRASGRSYARKEHKPFRYNGFSPGIGINSCLWWKVSVRDEYIFRIGLNVGYEYMDQLYAYRHFKVNEEKPLSSLSQRLKHIGHIGLNFALSLN